MQKSCVISAGSVADGSKVRVFYVVFWSKYIWNYSWSSFYAESQIFLETVINIHLCCVLPESEMRNVPCWPEPASVGDLGPSLSLFLCSIFFSLFFLAVGYIKVMNCNIYTYTRIMFIGFMNYIYIQHQLAL